MIADVCNHLWQSTLFTLVAAILALSLRRHRARIRFWIWLSASLKFLIPFSLLGALGSRLTWMSGAIPPAVTLSVGRLAHPLGSEPASQHADAIQLGLRLVTIVWALGCVIGVLRWIAAWIDSRRALANATPYVEDACIPLLTSPSAAEPSVVGILCPVMLLPADIATALPPAQLQAVLAHELAHAERRDNFTAALHKCVETLFWFHPITWWIGARLLEERERACDEAVLEKGHEPLTYAEGLLRVCRFSVGRRIALSAGMSGANLQRRIELIMTHRPLTLHFPQKACLAAALLAALGAPLVAGATARVQTPDLDPRAWTWTSVKRAPASTRSTGEFVVQNGKLSIRDMSLRELLARAYDVSQSQIHGGEWLDSMHYDLEATGTGVTATDAATYRAMITELLAKRFNLQVYFNSQCQASCERTGASTAE